LTNRESIYVFAFFIANLHNRGKVKIQMLSNGVPEPSASTTKKENGEWFNAGVEEVPASVYKQQNDDWLNADGDLPLEPVEESSLSRATSDCPEIQIKQDGSILNITVIASNNQHIKSEHTIVSLKINLPPQYLARKGEGPYDIEITEDDSFSSDQSLQDIITAKPVDEPIIQSHALMDEITVRPIESLVLASPQLMDEISIRPVGNLVTERQALMDEITVRPVESLVLVSPQLMDEISIRPAGNLVIASHALMDEVSIKPSPGPIKIEYELVDDLITRSAIYQTKKVKPSSNSVITNSVESPVEKTEHAKSISVNEITKILKEKRDFQQSSMPSSAVELSSTPLIARKGDGIGNLKSRTKSVHKKTGLRRVMTKVLATLRLYNNTGFYIQDSHLAQTHASMLDPQMKDFTFKVLNTTTELDELIDGGYDLVMNFSKIKVGLNKGMVAFLMFNKRELASMGWACLTEESKAIFRNYPYHNDFDRQACIVGDWTNPKYPNRGISSYIKYQRQCLLKEKGFTIERSIVEESVVKELPSMREQKRFELTYKRRTYTNVSLPGILGVEIWKEQPLNGADTQPPNKIITINVLVLPSPPGVAGS
jgi:hypothetical protein